MLNFKRPFWLVLFASIEMIAVGFLGTKLTPKIFQLFRIPYEKLGLQDLISMAFALLVFVGGACCIVCCLWCLIASILSCFRANQDHEK